MDFDSILFGCCEFQALLQRPDAVLKIELDGNDLGTGAFLLALALVCWTKTVKTTYKKARHVILFDYVCTFVHQ